MKKVILFLIFILLLPLVFADITITTDQNIYNLGNKIKASASILQNKDFEGLFRLTLKCQNYQLEYFRTPISLEANFRTAVNVPELTITSSMLGICSIIGDLITNDNLLIEQRNSNNFDVTNQLKVLPVSTKITALPDDFIQIGGIVNEAFGNNVLKAAINIILGNNSYATDATDGKLNFTIGIPKNIKSGIHIIEISASDSKNNFGSSSINLEITAVPIYIKTYLSGEKFAPGSAVQITTTLYDQADDIINASLDLELNSPQGGKVFTKNVQSNQKIEYEFSQYAEPGTYILISSYKNLVDKNSINITKVTEVRMRYENQSVIIANIGNMPFEDELTLLLESGLKKYAITKKIKLEPGKIINLDLSREVPYGIYDITAPIRKGLEPVKGKIEETIKDILGSPQESVSSLSSEKQSILAEDVIIDDNRPIHKKIASGFSSISALIVGADGVLAKNPLLAPMILLVILLLIIIRYGRKPLMRLIKGKKDEGNKDKDR